MSNAAGEASYAVTPREREVLQLIASGDSSKEIARSLSIAVKTVETHIDNLKLKTRTKNRAHLVAYAIQAHLI